MTSHIERMKTRVIALRVVSSGARRIPTSALGLLFASILLLTGCSSLLHQSVETPISVEKHVSLSTDEKTALLSAIRRHAAHGLYVTPNIPEKKKVRARKECQIPESDEVLALIDATVWGSAAHALVFGGTGIYIKNGWESHSPGRHFIPYNDFRALTIKSNTFLEVTIGKVNFEVSGAYMSKKAIIRVVYDTQQALQE